MLTVLIVEDEQKVREELAKALEFRGMKSVSAPDGKSAIQALNENNVDVVLLDLWLPDMHGNEVIKKIRETSRIPIIVLTGIPKGKLDDRDIIVSALQLGANDAMEKPFLLSELKTRIEKCVEDFPDSGLRYYFSGWSLDPQRRKLYDSSDAEVSLTNADFNLLLTFLKKPHQVISNRELIELAGLTPTVNISRRINNLREKIEEDPEKPDIIVTARGQGYQFTPGVMVK